MREYFFEMFNKNRLVKRQENHWAAVGGWGGGREGGVRVEGGGGGGGNEASWMPGSIPFLPPPGRDGGEERGREVRGAQEGPRPEGEERSAGMGWVAARTATVRALSACWTPPSPALALRLVACSKRWEALGIWSCGSAPATL